MKTLWFKPSFSHHWHILHKGQYGRMHSLCGTWRVPAGAVKVERADDEPGNCGSCLTVKQKSEGRDD